jgi:hypothetical protein
LIREEGGDLDRAGWLLKRARKLSERHAERHHRITLEEALLEGLKGNFDPAEAAAREACAKDPGNHRPFAVLGQVLAWRQMYVAAHAEFLRAKERAPMGSLEAEEYQAALLQLQAMIELQAARLYAGEDNDEIPSGPVSSHSRVIRRAAKKPQGEPATEAGEEPAEEPPEAPPEVHPYEEPPPREPPVEEPASPGTPEEPAPAAAPDEVPAEPEAPPAEPDAPPAE